MKTTRLYSVGLVTVMMLIFFQPTSAQLVDSYSSANYSNFINNLTSNYIWNSSMARYTKQYQGRSSVSRPDSTSSKSSINEVPAYRRYPAVQFKSTGTRLTVQEYLDSVGVSLQDKAELKELVLGIFKKYETEAAAKGYPNDWALAYVSYVGLNSHVYNGITEKPIIPLEQNVGLRDVVAEYATDNDIFKNVTDRKKQELYELLVMLGGLTYHFYEKAVREKDVEELKNIKLAAAQNLKMLGIKP